MIQNKQFTLLIKNLKPKHGELSIFFKLFFQIVLQIVFIRVLKTVKCTRTLKNSSHKLFQTVFKLQNAIHQINNLI
jgi:hypothetical protein